MAVDPYVYPGTDMLINRAGIRDLVQLRRFERLMTAQRIAEGFPVIRFDVPGFCHLHHHIFQDVYAWAGQLRTVEIAKLGALFCRPQFWPPSSRHASTCFRQICLLRTWRSQTLPT